MTQPARGDVTGEIPKTDIFDPLLALQRMQKTLLPQALLDLREGDRPTVRQRIEAILKVPGAGYSGPGHHFSHMGGNSHFLQYSSSERPSREFFSSHNGAVMWSDADDGGKTELAIYPLGIAGVNPNGQPIFHPPSTDMYSVVLVNRNNETSRQGVFERPVEPLFNVHNDGVVRARILDEPTPAEYQLFHDVLVAFEDASGARY